MTIPFEKLKASVLANPRGKAEYDALAPEDVAARLMKIGEHYAALPDTGRTPDEILGYDDDGVPES